MYLSVVIPCYNEEQNVKPFYEAISKTFGELMNDTELIFVNDGSRDKTLEELENIAKASPYCVKVIGFSRNFGKEAALLAGLSASTGEYTSIIDADLQQRPDLVRDMVAFLDENPEFDVVASFLERGYKCYAASVYTADTGVIYRTLNFNGKSFAGRFADILSGKDCGDDYDSFIKPVALINAIKRSFESGKTETVNLIRGI